MRRAPYGALAAAAASVSLATSAAAAPGSTLDQRLTLTSGQSLSSPSGQYLFVMQSDGNVVLSNQGRLIWASNTERNPGARLTLQTDGDVVVSSPRNVVVWQSNIRGSRGAQYRLSVQDDGNVVVYTEAGRAIAATRTNQPSFRNPRGWARFWPAEPSSTPAR